MPNKSRSETNSRIVRVRDLPVYYDRKNDDIARYIPKLPEEQERHWFQRTLNNQKVFRLKLKSQTEATINAIRNEKHLLPKFALVTTASLTPFLFGHKRKKVYSSLAALVAMSACYPKQSVQMIDEISRRFVQRRSSSTDSTLYKKRPVKNEKKM